MAPSADDAYLCGRLERDYLEAALGRDQKGRPRHLPLGLCLMSLPELLFALPLGSPYAAKARRVILRLTETGITERVVGSLDLGRVGDEDARDGAGPRAEDLAHLRPSLLLLACGLSLSALVFLLELSLAPPPRPQPMTHLQCGVNFNSVRLTRQGSKEKFSLQPYDRANFF